MLQNKLFDTHTHMDDEAFNEDRHEAVKRAYESGVRHMVNIGSTIESSRSSIALSEKYDFMYAAVGIHPHEAKSWTRETENELLTLWKHPKNRAIGEIGLDYHYDLSERSDQKAVFIRQMELAQEIKLPVVIHSREATEDTLAILKMFPMVKGVIHCYSGSLESAKIFVKLGYMLSFTGVITYKNAVKAIEVVKWLDNGRIMAETDAPYLTPVPFRGKRNETANVRYVVEKMAEIKGMSFEEMAAVTYENALRFYNIQELK